MPSSRILVAISTPWAGDKLYATIRDLADRLQASVVAAHVARPTEEDETTEDTRRRAEQTLTTITSRLSEAHVRAEGLLLWGEDVARAILHAAEDQRATLLVISLSGKGRVARLLAGDIPMQIIKGADIPVLLFPPDYSGAI